MKTKDLVFSRISLSVLVAAVIVALYAFSVTAAFAQVVPTINTSIKNGSNTTITTATIGTAVRAVANVSSSTGPVALGTVDFSLYPNTTCSSTATVQGGVLLASGSVDSSTTTLGSNGLSYRVLYNGQNGVYSSTTGSCVSLQPTSTTVNLNSTLSSTTIKVGTTVFQNSTLSGVTSSATGTVAYAVYTNNACSADKVDAGTKTVVNGIVPSSNSIQFNTVGTFYWQAKYSGDQFNNNANGSCQTLSVMASSPTPVTPAPTSGTGTISGISFNDLNKNKIKDNSESGISGFTIRLYGGTFWWNWGRPRVVATTTTDINGNYSFTGLSDGLYRIEETKQNGWAQISPDYKWVLLINGRNLTGLDFANLSRGNATGTINQDKDDDKDKNKGQEKKQEKIEKKEIKKEAQKQKKINKLFDRIYKIRGNSNDNDDRDD